MEDSARDLRRRAGEEYDGSSEAVWRFVCSLPPKQRAVVVLRFYEQLTEVEIAAPDGHLRKAP